jgi:hypothetical protein
MRFGNLSLGLPKIGLNNETVTWGALLLLGAATLGIAGQGLIGAGNAVDKFSEGPIVTEADKLVDPLVDPFLAHSNFAWSEGMPWRDRNVWYQWKSDWQGNDPTKRLTVA